MYAKTVKSQIGAELQSKMFSMKFDIAARKNRNFFSISVQFIDEDWQMAIRYLAMKEIEGATTSANLQKIISDTLQKYNLKSTRINAITTDGGTNVMRTSKNILKEADEDIVASILDSDDDEDLGDEIELDFEREKLLEAAKFFNSESRCGAHVIQSAVGDFLKLDGRKEFITSLRTITKKARTAIRKLPAESRPALPVLSNETRWSSSYKMVSFFDYKK